MTKMPLKIIYARNSNSARKKGKTKTRTVTMVKRAKGPERNGMKPYTVWTLRKKCRG